MVSSLISPLIDWALIRLITERLPSRFTARWIEVMRLARPKNGEFTSFRRAPERPGSWLISLAMFFRSGLGMTCSICRSTMIWGCGGTLMPCRAWRICSAVSSWTMRTEAKVDGARSLPGEPRHGAGFCRKSGARQRTWNFSRSRQGRNEYPF